MARTPRKNMRNSSFFHIMVQGINKEFIFNTKENMERYYNLVFRNNEGVDIIAFCIMNNHAHILVCVKEIEKLEEWMRKTNISYAMFYNEKNNRVGYVFRNRYKVQVIKNERHLYLCAEYIHNNPVKAGICKYMGDYEFSSFSKLYNKDELNVYNAIKSILNSNNWYIQSKVIEENEFELAEDDEIDKYELCQNIVKEFLRYKQLSINDLRVETINLIELVTILKDENKISYRMIEKCIGISREKLRKLKIGGYNGKFTR